MMMRAVVTPVLLATSLALALWGAVGEAAEDDHDPYELTAGVAAVYNDNVTRAENDDDIAGDAAIEGSVAYGWRSEGIAGSSLGWTVSLRGAKFDEFEDLDHVEAAAEGIYRVQFRRGFFAPVYEVSVKAAALDYGSRIRDGWRVEAGGLAMLRLTDRLVGRAGARYMRRESSDFETFDIRRTSVFGNLDLRVDRRSVGYLTAVVATGDVVSTAEPTLDIINWAEVIEPDDAFGGVPANRFAYRLDADVAILTLGYNRKLGPDSSIDLSVEGLHADAEGPNEYDRVIARLSYLQRF